MSETYPEPTLPLAT